MQLNELMNLCTKLSDRILALENTNTSQATEIAKLKERIKKLEKKRRSRIYKSKRLYKGRKIADLDADVEVTLIDENQRRNDEDLMLDTGVLNGDEVFKEPMVNAATTTSSIPVSVADPVTTAGEVVTTANATTINKFSKKEKIRLNEEFAFKIQAEEQEEERIAREKAQKIQEANIAWDDIQATIEADYQLAQRLHNEEQEQYTDEEKAKFFCEFLDQRRKFFAAKRVEAKRNKPPTQAQ
ncbi:hypothetical protein Tco_0526843 [Tanacetum coccineum]